MRAPAPALMPTFLLLSLAVASCNDDSASLAEPVSAAPEAATMAGETPVKRVVVGRDTALIYGESRIDSVTILRDTTSPAPGSARVPVVTGQAPRGRVDSVAPDGVVYGWSYDPDEGYWQNSVEIYLDVAAVEGRKPDAILKADVFDSYAGRHGFRYSIPAQYRDGVSHTVYAYGLDLRDSTGISGTLLMGAPKSFTLGRPAPVLGSAPSPAPTAPPVPSPTGGSVCSIAPVDGQEAIAAAIRGCPNGSVVQFPIGATYHQSDKISVEGRRDLVIDGRCSTFIKTSAAANGAARPNWHLASDTNLVLRNMKIRGAFVPAAYNNGRRHIIPGNQWEHGINVAGGSGITIQDVQVSNVFGEFVTVQPNGDALKPVARNVRVERLHGEHAARQCVAPIGVIGFWLVDSYLADCWQSGVDMEIDWPGEKLQDIHILRNTVAGVWGSAFTVPVKGNPGDVANIEIRGNVVTSAPDVCLATVLITYAPNNQGNSTQLHGIVVEDNQLKTLHTGVQMQDVASGSIRNNRIENTAGTLCGPPSPTPGVRLINSSNVVASGNAVVGY